MESSKQITKQVIVNYEKLKSVTENYKYNYLEKSQKFAKSTQRILDHILEQTDPITHICIEKYAPNTQANGRLHSEHGLGFQSLRREIRSQLLSENYIELDIENFMTCILYQLCQQKKIDCPFLKEYNEKREEILKDICKVYDVTRPRAKCYVADVMSRANGWRQPRPGMSCAKIKELEKYPWLANLGDEAEHIVNSMFPENDGKTNVFFDMIHETENKIMLLIDKYLKENMDTELKVLTYDGGLIERNYADKIHEHINSLVEYIRLHSGYSVAIRIKEI